MKRFLLMNYYGSYEGWNIVAQADTEAEIAKAAANHTPYGSEWMVVERREIMLVPKADQEKEAS